MRFTVTTEFGRGRVYKSVDDADQAASRLLALAAEGKLSYLSFDSETGTKVMLPAKVLETSIIEIID